MRQKLFCGNCISFILIALYAVLGCNPPNTRTKQPIIQNVDSVEYYLSETNSISDTQYIQNLERAYSLALKVSNDSLKSHYFSNLALNYYLTANDSAQFRKMNRIALQLSKKIRDSVALANNHWDLASFYSDYVVEDSAYYHYSEAEKIFRALNDSFYSARMLYNMAIIQSEVKDYIGSEINTIRAIELFKPLDRYENLYHCYNNLGSLSNALKEYDRALEYYDQALFYYINLIHKVMWSITPIII